MPAHFSPLARNIVAGGASGGAGVPVQSGPEDVMRATRQIIQHLSMAGPARYRCRSPREYSGQNVYKLS
jgi:hypothetical protein